MKTPLVTREGYEKLKQELNYLWREERPEVTKKVTWAASLGDRSENADYQYNKKRLREIEPSPCAISLNAWKISKSSITPAAGRQSLFGAWVEIENDDGVTLPFPYCRLTDEILDRKVLHLYRFPDGPRIAEKEVGDLAVVNTLPGSELVC